MSNIIPDILIKRRSWICVLFFILFSFTVFSQEKDSAKKDPLRIYKKIKHFAYKHKATAWMYDAVFVDPEPKEYPVEPASKEEKNINPYLKYKDRIIREINITVYDPFGHSIYDTMPRNINNIQRLGNRLHITTRHWIIINRLLFQKNDTIDALALSETERILRQSVFINDARIFITETKSKDSIDVNIVLQDKWPITVPILITDVSGNIRFRNQNLFGVGQQLEHYVGYKRPNIFEFNGFYNIANIDNTYISSQLAYRTDINGTQIGLGFDRGFFSPLSKWAGGLNFTRYWRYYGYTDPVDSFPTRAELNIFSYDIWAGRSFKLSDEKSLFNQSTNLVAGLRFYNSTFIERPPFTIDKEMGNQNTSAIVGNLGFAIQQYYKEKYVYRFGATEDVPEGIIVQFIYGGIKKEFKKLRYYAGMEIARAKHFNFGYLSTTLSHGVFFNRYVSNDITTNLKFYYFSDLAKRGDWFFRQFLSLNITHGENKLSNETLTLLSEELYGLDGTGLSGNTKATLNSETVAYMPYNIIGFKFAPIVMMGFGMIGDPANKISNSRLYQSYSIGVMVRNENLLSSTFQISVGMYPFLPNGDNYVFKYNPVTSFTLRVRVFSVSRPEFVSY
ncbi:MAG: hypothetical protein JNJ40_07685 [Bacteroidia bacterium]|nr:hypothetical protein [Bacteroidia bacterium]